MSSLPARVARRGRAYAVQRLSRLDPDAVLYDSFGGRYSDNPRAVFEELTRRAAPLRHTWVGDAAPGRPGVERGTLRHLRALGEAGYIVGNAQQPRYVEKKSGATYLQTWHGTPLKRIGFDNPRWSPAGLEELAREVGRWDYLVSQNEFSTGVFRQAFRYEGPILETGYPRNDVLSSPDRDRLAAEVRERLGIAPAATVVLYAPTWRDDDLDDQGRQSFSLELDLSAMANALDSDVVVLLRLHYTIPDIAVAGHEGFVRNVSAHPDIRDLYLAADVLLTDYSSAMFDFAVTGKPMLFFTYDLDAYRDEVRGFYFDLAEVAPGPLLDTTDDVIQALRRLDAVQRDYAASYAAFRDRFCPHDDGGAAARVVDRVFSSG